METFNLGAVIFAMLLGLWVLYALPHTARRRSLMGQAMAPERVDVSAAARDLTADARAYRSSWGETPRMTDEQLLLRPADPTHRPRFADSPGTRIEPEFDRERSQRFLTVLLVVLAMLTASTVALALLGYTPWWIPVIAGVGFAMYVAALRHAEMERRQRRAAEVRKARQEAAAAGRDERAAHFAALAPGEASPAAARAAAEAERALEGSSAVEVTAGSPVDGAAGADEATANSPETDGSETDDSYAARKATLKPGQWLPRAVPTPTYMLRGTVEDLGTRHAAHRAMLAAPTALEVEDLEEREHEWEFGAASHRGDATDGRTSARTSRSAPRHGNTHRASSTASAAPAIRDSSLAQYPEPADIDLDNVLARRRA